MHDLASAQSRLQLFVQKYKKLIPDSKHDAFDSLIGKLLTSQLDHDQFDKLICKLVMPSLNIILPDKYRPFPNSTYEQEQKVSNFFQLTQTEKYELLEHDEELVELLHQILVTHQNTVS